MQMNKKSNSVIFFPMLLLMLILTVHLFPQGTDKKEKTETKETEKKAASKPKKSQGKVFAKIFTYGKYDITKKSSGFDVNRAYFGGKHKFNKQLKTKVTFDVGRVEDDTRLEAYLKTAYLDWAFIPEINWQLGLHGLRQFKIQEGFWGYRYIEKSFMDKNKFGSSADFGTSLQIKPADVILVNLAFLNGEGYKSLQLDNSYKGAASTELKLVKLIQIVLYYDMYQGGQQTAASFIGLKTDSFRIGVEYNYQFNYKESEGDAQGLSVYSTFVLDKQWEIFARYDLLLKTNSYGVLGFQYAPVKGVKMSLNYRGSLADGGAFSDLAHTVYLNSELKF